MKVMGLSTLFRKNSQCTSTDLSSDEEEITAVPLKYSKFNPVCVFQFTHLLPENTEAYRKSYFCSVPGCTSTRALKKLSNHLVQVHNIKDLKKREYYLRLSKKAGPQRPKQKKVLITIKEAFARAKADSSDSAYLVTPDVADMKGKTNRWPRYSLDTPILTEYLENLQSFDGGSHSHKEAEQIVTDVAKFMAFADAKRARWSSLTHEPLLKAYLTKLTRAEIGPDGLCTKTDRLIRAVQYGLQEKLLPIDEGQSAVTRMNQWKKTFRKGKHTHALARAAESTLESGDEALAAWNSFRMNPKLLVSYALC